MAKIDFLAVSGIVFLLLGLGLFIYQIDGVSVSIPVIARVGLAFIIAGLVLIYLKQKGFKLTV